MEKQENYKQILSNIAALIEDEQDEVAVLSSVVCELHNGIEYFHWTGFYRRTEPEILKVGPYQGTHGCLTISFDRGVCGKAAREEKTQLVENVNDLPYHIACAGTTKSEIVVPVFTNNGVLHSVLDVDSNNEAAFDVVDQEYLEKVAEILKDKL